MRKISVISSSVRDGRLSHRVALFVEKYLNKQSGTTADVIDLLAYDFPVFHERLFNMPDAPADVKDYARRVTEADGIVVVTPVYNGSFPAALKNVVDLLYKEWQHKPVLIVSVTHSTTPGIATVQQLQAIFLKMGARVAGPLYTVLNAGTDFSETGDPVNPAQAEKYAEVPIRELIWMIDKTKEK